eukprot:CAMPEP_0176475080 /NCGR_PEP_ID=MMETSP0127-20121128/43401_1 /TAXON_ID=938130 /ORGANISM="Platyophrya macrostoma, Strain WH" /LENGTH=261 /DNA_ID=CAMNT_0017870623 /DNA_START=81 /DNA_END=863 /DNA_ORIENTATION=-
MTAQGLRVKKQAGICAAAGVSDVSTTTVVDTVGDVTDGNRGDISDVVAFVEETTVATTEQVAELVNEVAHTPEEKAELTHLIDEVVHVVEAEETHLSTHEGVEAATGVVEGEHNVEVIVDYIHETTVATPQEIQEIVEQVTENHHQAEELTEILDGTIQVVNPAYVEREEQIPEWDLPGYNGNGVPPEEQTEENGEVTFAVPIGHEEISVEYVEREEQIPEWDLPGYNGNGVPPEEQIEENGEVTWGFAENGEAVYFTEET